MIPASERKTISRGRSGNKSKDLKNVKSKPNISKMFSDNSDIKDLIPVPEVMKMGDLIPDLIPALNPVDAIALDTVQNLTI